MITQTIAGDLIPQIWETEVEYEANNRRGAIKYVTDTGSKYFGAGKTINWPKIPVLPSANVKTTYPTVTYADPTTTNVATATPTVVYTGLIMQEDTLLTTVKDGVQLYAPLLTEGLYQKLDIDILSLYGSSGMPTAITDGAAFTEANFLAALGSLQESCGDKAGIGDMTGIYHIGHWNDIFGVTNIISAQVRGETNGPAKTGVFDTIYGVRIFFTANVQLSSTYRNLLFARKFAWVARKNRPKIELQREDLTTKVMASHMYKVAVLHGALGIEHRVNTK